MLSEVQIIPNAHRRKMMNSRSTILFIALWIAICSWSASAEARYNFFGGFIPEGTPAIDGVLSPGEWDEMGRVVLYKFFGEDSKIEIHLMWDANYLYLAADIQDYELWIDSYYPDRSWESTWNDDALKWEIDPNNSKHEYLQPSDRVLAVNADGSAIRFDKGDGAGGTNGIWVDPAGGYVRAAAKTYGSINDFTFKTLSASYQKDQGFVLEMAVQWRQLFDGDIPPLLDGYVLGMNFTNIEDDTGGELDPEYYEEWKRVADELTRFMGEEDHPENWASFALSDRQDKAAPGVITGLSVTRTTPFSADVAFNASGDNASSGYAHRYDLRYSTSPLTEENWENATICPNSFRPKESGQPESFQIIGLSPGTTYHLGIKAVDERENPSPLASAAFSTSQPTGGDDKGFLTVDPGGRYFAWENGEPIIVIGENQGVSWPHIRSFYDGLMWSDDLGRYVNFRDYDIGGMNDGRSYLQKLREHGVNTIRIMAEDIEPTHPVYFFDDVSGGANNISFNQDTIDFLRTFMDECAAVGINVIIVPFDTFYYSNKFNGWAKVPFSAAMGGPMAAPEDFFEPQYRDYIKSVLRKLVEVIGDRKNLLAWDIVNEFDSDEPGIGWNRAAFAKRETTLNELADYLKSIDPDHMVYISSVRWDPKFSSHMTTRPDTSVMGNDAALILNDDRYDFNSTHMYYHDIRDPNYNSKVNPGSIYRAEACDLDNTVAPAAWVKQGLQFYYAYNLNPKPYLCTEFGPIQFYVTDYDQYFTEEDDNQIFHNMIWSYLASGEAGTGLRWPGSVMEDHELTDRMRDYQLALHNFIEAGNFDFRGFSPMQIGQYMTVENSGAPVIKTGITDGRQGILFLVNDERQRMNGPVAGARLTVPKLQPNGVFNFEFWDSYDSIRTSPVETISVTANPSGQAVIDIPFFEKTQAIQFYCTECPEVEIPLNRDGGYTIVSDLWLKTVLKTPAGPVTLKWKEVGVDITASGDQVVSGYFYADPNDFAYGSEYNPEAFIKIYIASNGWANIAVNHVTVDSIDVYSAHYYNGTPDQLGTATINDRLVEHQYTGVSIQQNVASGVPGSKSSNGYTVSSNLWLNTIFKTPVGDVTLIWKEVGTDTTPSGDKVVSGYFYADPEDFAYGSPFNPEAFVKIYIASNGWANIAVNHVTVDDIDVFSAHNYDGAYDQFGKASLQHRLVEHQYTGVSIGNVLLTSLGL